MEALGALVFAVVAAVYALPIIVAGSRGHHQTAPIAVLTIFLGWTFLGWVGALVWSFSAIPKEHRPAPVAPAAPRTPAQRAEDARLLTRRIAIAAVLVIGYGIVAYYFLS